MNLIRAAALVGGAGLLVAWLAIPFTTRAGAPPGERGPSVPLPFSPLASEIQAQADRLRDRLRTAPGLAPPLRNAFRFAPRRPARLRETVATTSAITPADPAPPAIVLSGIAEDATPDGVERTAVLNVMGKLFLAKEGDAVPPRYRVVRISADGVQLADVAGGTPLTLVLK